MVRDGGLGGQVEGEIGQGSQSRWMSRGSFKAGTPAHPAGEVPRLLGTLQAHPCRVPGCPPARPPHTAPFACSAGSRVPQGTVVDSGVEIRGGTVSARLVLLALGSWQLNDAHARSPAARPGAGSHVPRQQSPPTTVSGGRRPAFGRRGGAHARRLWRLQRRLCLACLEGGSRRTQSSAWRMGEGDRAARAWHPSGVQTQVRGAQTSRHQAQRRAPTIKVVRRVVEVSIAHAVALCACAHRGRLGWHGGKARFVCGVLAKEPARARALGRRVAACACSSPAHRRTTEGWAPASPSRGRVWPRRRTRGSC